MCEQNREDPRVAGGKVTLMIRDRAIDPPLRLLNITRCSAK